MQSHKHKPHFHDSGHPGSVWASRLGTLLGVGCAIHCALTPFLVVLLPAAGQYLQNDKVEWLVIAMSFLLGVFSLYHGYKKHHHKREPLICFFIGFSFFIVGHILEDRAFLSYFFILPAIVLLIYAQWRNFKLNRATACTHDHHS